jgi:LysM repeat protein
MVIPKRIFIAIAFFALLFLSVNKQNSATVTAGPIVTSYGHNYIFNLTKNPPHSSRDSLMDSILSVGKLFIGRPYRSRVYNSWPLDCSGFAAYLYSLFGYQLPHASPAQAQLGDKIPKDSLKMGDLMFFKGRSSRSKSVGHTAIFYKAAHDTIYFLHSSSTGIRIDKLNGYQYYTARYLYSKRMNLDQLKKIPVDSMGIVKVDSALKKIRENAKNKTVTASHSSHGGNGTTASDGKTYTIRQGDSLYAISRKYGTTVEKLCALNGIKKTSLLRIGQKIKIK